MRLLSLFRKPVLATLHAGILLVIAGALLTWLSGDSGRLHLRVGESVSGYDSDSGSAGKLPFSIKLLDFNVENYPGTRNPVNYVSTVEVCGETIRIWPNHILRKGGYRFYQSAYDEDERGSVLLVSYDPWGTSVVYLGYILIVISMIGFFFSKRSRWAAALKMSAVAIVLAVAGVQPLAAENPARVPKTVPVEVAGKFSRLSVNHNGRIAPMQTMMKDYVLKVYGRKTLPGYTTGQIFMGWMFWYDSWGDQPVKAKNENDLADRKAVMESVASGLALKIFPVPGEDGSVCWYSPSEHLPGDMDADEWLFVRKVMTLVRSYCIEGEYANACEVLDKVIKWQNEKAPEAIPSPARVNAEGLYNVIGLPRIPAMLSLLVGLVAFFCWILGRGGRWARLWRIFAGGLFLYLLLLIGLRWGVSGHIPMTNGFELMLLIACLSFGLAFFHSSGQSFILPMGILLGGFATLVSSMSQSNPQIGSLMPVLSSPLLCLHVSAMMISYTLFGLIALNSLAGLLKRGASRECANRSVLMLYPALFLLVGGTILGSVWANISWGGYWTWDPKETWSLITIIIYSIPVHSGFIRMVSRPAVFNAYCLIAFASVLFTYFGVNYLLGGLHSYA
ncbi:MAG: cytochrome c biogenesis protein CcsA [Candidatus Cryptobacteroides sp.]